MTAPDLAASARAVALVPKMVYGGDSSIRQYRVHGPLARSNYWHFSKNATCATTDHTNATPQNISWVKRSPQGEGFCSCLTLFHSPNKCVDRAFFEEKFRGLKRIPGGERYPSGHKRGFFRLVLCFSEDIFILIDFLSLHDSQSKPSRHRHRFWGSSEYRLPV